MALGEPRPMSTLSGASARTVEGDDIGTVQDVVLDDSSDRIRFAVIERASDARLLVVPWSLVTFRPGERVVRLGVPARKLNTAPALNPAESLRVESPEWQREISGFYGSRPYWEETWDEPAPVVRASGPRRRRGSSVLPSLVLLGLVVGLGYVVIQQGWTTTTDQVRSVAATVRDSTKRFRSTSADAATTAKVKTALTLAKDVSSLDINVDTHN